MKPKFIYQTAAEIPEALRSFYVEKDGAFTIDLEGAPDPKKLAEFRENNITLQKRLADEQKKWEGLDLEEVRKLVAIKGDLEEQKLVKKGDVDAAVKARLDPMVKEWETKLATIAAERDKAMQEFTTYRISAAVTSEAAKSGVRPEALPDISARATNAIRVENGEIVITDGKATRYNAATGAPMTVAEWLAEQAKTAPHLFEPNKGGGSPGGQQGKQGGDTSVNPWKKETWNMTLQADVYRKDPALARQMAASAGVNLPLPQNT